MSVDGTGAPGPPGVDPARDMPAALVLEALDLPRGSAVRLCEDATASIAKCLAAARAVLIERTGSELAAAACSPPEIRAVVPDSATAALLDALRRLGFGFEDVLRVPCDNQGRVIPGRIPPLGRGAILCLQAGEGDTGSFDRFDAIIRMARNAGAWVHVAGASGMWVRASSRYRDLARSVELADSWSAGVSEWLVESCATSLAICRHPDAPTGPSSSVSPGAGSSALTSFAAALSEDPAGASLATALQPLGREGLQAKIDWNASHAWKVADALEAAGLEVLNEVPFNQVLFRGRDDAGTSRLIDRVLEDSSLGLSAAAWKGRPALRMTSWSWPTNRDQESRSINRLLRACTEATEAAAPRLPQS